MLYSMGLNKYKNDKIYVALIILFSFYRLPDGTEIQLDKDKMFDAAMNSKLYKDNYEYDSTRQQRSYDEPAKIFVINGDCLDTVMYIKNTYPNCNPVVLNMANAVSPGGGWRDGLF